MEMFGVTQYLFNPLTIWNNPLGVNALLTEKPSGSFAQAEAENCPREKFQVKILIPFFISHF